VESTVFVQKGNLENVSRILLFDSIEKEKLESLKLKIRLLERNVNKISRRMTMFGWWNDQKGTFERYEAIILGLQKIIMLLSL